MTRTVPDVSYEREGLGRYGPGLHSAWLGKQAVMMDFDGRRVHVASLDDLIRMKRAAGRAKDRVELEIFGALRDVIDDVPE